MSIDLMLRTAFGLSATQGSLSTGDSLALYRQSVDRAGAEAARILRDPVFRRDMAHLERAVATARTPQDLLKNPRTVGLLLEGLGLGDQAKNGGIARAALLSDPTERSAVVNRLPDQRWKTAARRLDLANSGLRQLRDPAIMQELRDGVVQYRRITAISQKSQAVADAVYLRERVPAAPIGIYGVLGDQVLRRMATTVADVPKELAFQSVEAQARTLGARFDTRQLETTKGREALIQRYLVKATMGEAGGGGSPILQLFA